jgi:hypothetical protein
VVPLRLNAAKTEGATFDYQAIARLRRGQAAVKLALGASPASVVMEALAEASLIAAGAAAIALAGTFAAITVPRSIRRWRCTESAA